MWMLGKSPDSAPEITLLVTSHYWRDPSSAAMCMQEFFEVCSNSFSLFHTHFGRENRGATCPLQARDRVLRDPINPVGSRGT